MDYRAKPTTLKCVECDFTCRSGNDMCRHIFSTGHGTRPCPTCGAVLVPRAFQASLQKLIERTPMGAPVGPTFAAAGPHTRIHAVGCEQCPGHPSFTFYEKNNFVVADTALELRPHSESATDPLGSSTGGASSPQHSTAEGTNEKAFRCMECLNFCPTWTQVSKHIEQSGHTLAVCVQCERNLKCFGPQHPVQHEISHGHCGFFGVFYTRRDYRSDTQASRLVYNSANLFTGLTTLQYKCVCGLSFLHPVHLAHHLRSVHHVTCIRDSARCHCCGMCGSLTELIAHLQRPCWEEDGGKAHPNMRRTTVPENALAVAALEIGIENAASDKDPIGLDTSAALSHAVEVVGFSGSAFLQFRPLLPPLTDEEVPLLGDAHALATAGGGSASASASATAAPLPQASYAVLYQCRECLFLFSNWDGIVQHIHATGHCRTFCTECNSFLPELLSQSASDGYAGWRSQPQPPNPHAAHQPPPVPAQEDDAAVVPGLGLSATLRDHLKHLRRHGDIIGYPASPETLEVLVDVRAACYTGTIDPAAETFSAPRTLMVYQCSDFHDGCYKVFLHYGDFVAHLLTTGHGTKQVQRASPQTGKQVTLRALPTCYPMVSYRAKFTVMQLCEHFNFVQCPYCETAVPRAEEELHAALCVERRRHSASRGH